MAVAAGVDPLARLAAELWRPEDLRRGGPSEGFAPHAVIGGADGGALSVLPIANRAVAAASTLRWTDATTLREAVIRGAGWVGLRTGAANPLLHNRIAIRTAGGDGQCLHQYLAEVIDSPQVHVASAFGSERPNQKPVLRIFDAAGETRAFAKVGWNELTRKLVETESRFLGELSGKRLATMLVPRPIHDGTWNGRSLAVASALVGSANAGRSRPPGLRVLEELASLSDRFRQRIGTSAYRDQVHQRSLILPPGSPAEQAMKLVDRRWADLEIEFGHWHGDWAPWNVRRDGDRYIVWDWERNSPGVPAGFDAIHFAFQPRFPTAADPLAALLKSLEEVRVPLRGLGVEDEAEVPVALMYLTELFLRFSDAGAGQPAAAGEHVEQVGQLLGEAVRHFGS